MKILACVLLVIALSNVVAENDIAVTVYPNSTEMPEVTARLLETKGTTWIAARAYRTNDPINDVVKYFRDEAGKARKPADENEYVKRLLEDNWDTIERIVAAANVVFGFNKEAKGMDRRGAKFSFGTILLNDSLVRVHIMSPYPVPPDGMTVTPGTMIVMIRERMTSPIDTAVNPPEDEPVYTGRDVPLKVRLRSKPAPHFPVGVYGTVKLKAVFASSGKVTNISVVQPVPGLTEEAINAARKITFDPAMKDGRYVSQWMQLEYNVH